MKHIKMVISRQGSELGRKRKGNILFLVVYISIKNFFTMKKTTVTLLAQTILTLDSGTHEAVRDGGNLYLLVQQEEDGGFEAPSTPTPNKATKATAAAAVEEVAEEAVEEAPRRAVAKPAAKSEVKTYTEAELMKMETDDVLEIVENLGINPNDYDGKNTNKKLRILVLEFQKGTLDVGEAKEAEEVVDDTQEEEEAPAPRRSAGRGAAKKAAPRKLDEDEIESLEDGDMVYVKLDMGDEPTEDPDKLWEAEVMGWKVPDGGRTEKLHVKFQEDGQEDYLRDGDEVYEYATKI